MIIYSSEVSEDEGKEGEGAFAPDTFKRILL